MYLIGVQSISFSLFNLVTQAVVKSTDVPKFSTNIEQILSRVRGNLKSKIRSWSLP